MFGGRQSLFLDFLPAARLFPDWSGLFCFRPDALRRWPASAVRTVTVQPAILSELLCILGAAGGGGGFAYPPRRGGRGARLPDGPERRAPHCARAARPRGSVLAARHPGRRQKRRSSSKIFRNVRALEARFGPWDRETSIRNGKLVGPLGLLGALLGSRGMLIGGLVEAG